MKTMFFTILTLSAAFLTACSTTADAEKNKTEKLSIADVQVPEAELKKISESAIREIFRGIEKNDYSIFRKSFYEKVTTEKNFKQLSAAFHEKNGKMENLKYLDTLQVGVFKVTVWKVRFARSQKLIDAMKRDNRKPEAIPLSDMLIRLYLGNIGGQWKVFSISFN